MKLGILNGGRIAMCDNLRSIYDIQTYEMEPYIKLYIAVIQQMMLDARPPSPNARVAELNNHKQAVNWFKGSEFILLCRWLGLNHTYVQRKIEEAKFDEIGAFSDKRMYKKRHAS